MPHFSTKPFPDIQIDTANKLREALLTGDCYKTIARKHKLTPKTVLTYAYQLVRADGYRTRIQFMAGEISRLQTLLSTQSEKETK